METDKILVQLVALLGEVQEISCVLRQNVTLSKNTGILLKRHSEKMNALLLQQGVETLPAVLEENSLLVDQNLILIEQREIDLQALQLLHAKLDALRADNPEHGHKARAAQMPSR
jgi:hypothetical protein